MSLLTRIGTPPAPFNAGCSVERVCDTLDEQDAQDLLVLVDDPRWPYVTLARKLREAGIKVSEKAIRKHRLKMCDCYPVGEAS